jgi:DNA polymerase-3 subunit gamma/tau
VQPKAVRYIAKAADGSMRDALSLLDQCIAFYLGQNLTYDRVLEVLGAVDTEVFSNMLRKIMKKDISGVISQLEELMIQGREPGQFVTDFTWYLRNLLLLQSSDNMEDVLDISSENLALLKEEAELVETIQLMRYIRVFSELSNQIRYAVQKRVMIEVALIKLCKPEMERDYDSLVLRIAQLEQKLEAGIPIVSLAGAEQEKNKRIHVSKDVSNKEAPAAKLPRAVPEDVQQVIKNWRSILEELPGGLKNYLRMAHPSMTEAGKLSLILEDEVAEAFVNTQEHQEELRAAMAKKTGREIPFKIF